MHGPPASGRPLTRRGQVESAAGVVARRQVARVHLGPQRHPPALPTARSRAEKPKRSPRSRRRHRVRLVARRLPHRLHDDRSGDSGNEGAHREVRRVHPRGPRPPHGAAPRGGRRDQGDPALTSGAFVVGAFDWSPDGSRHRLRPPREQRRREQRQRRHLAGRGGRRRRSRPLVTQDGPDEQPAWSPDGRRMAFQSAMAKPFYFFENGALAMVTAERRHARVDHQPLRREPVARGVDRAPAFLCGVAAHLVVSLPPRSGQPARPRCTASARTGSVSSCAVTPAGTQAAFVASGRANSRTSTPRRWRRR